MLGAGVSLCSSVCRPRQGVVIDAMVRPGQLAEGDLVALTGQYSPFVGLLLYADERTRTSTQLPGHGPEPCASTNSATSAWWVTRRYRTGVRRAALSDSCHLRPSGSGHAAAASLSRDGPPPGVALIASAASSNAPPSSRGLGRRPLTAVTRVRIPLAVLSRKALRCGAFLWRSGRGQIRQCAWLPNWNEWPMRFPS
jgi:hypothetical protein